MSENNIFDAIIIGGSYSGLSAAMALGRSLRKTLIIDDGNPCNKQTPHSHNFLTQDGNTPQEISKRAREDVEKYESVQFYKDLAITGKKVESGFEIGTKKGKTFSGKKLIFATGIKDILPDIKGFSECWGITVIHCPYCHGYEFRHQKTAIMANGEWGFHLAQLVNNLTKELTILANGNPDFSPEQLTQLNHHGITIKEAIITEIEHEKGQIKNVVFNDGSKIDFKAVYAAIPFSQQTDIPEKLDCDITEHGYIQVDDFQKTNVDGVFACGDNSTFMRSVSNSVARGNVAGAMVNKELTEAQFFIS